MLRMTGRKRSRSPFRHDGDSGQQHLLRAKLLDAVALPAWIKRHFACVRLLRYYDDWHTNDEDGMFLDR